MELVENGAGFFQRLTVVVGQAGVEGLAAAHRLRQSTHGLFQRGVGVHPVVVEDVYVLEAHPLQALVEAGQQVFPASPVTVRPLPHGVARLGADEELIAVGGKIFLEDAAKVLLGAARLGAVVVGEVEVGDAVVERRAAEQAHVLEVRGIAEVVPQAQRDGGQHQAAFAAAVVGQGGAACRRCSIHGGKLPFSYFTPL